MNPVRREMAEPAKNGLDLKVRDLDEAYGGLGAFGLLGALIQKEFPGRIGMVSAFGVESAVLLDLVARVDPATPVIFLNTGKLFKETLDYQEKIRDILGLEDVRIVEPDPADLAANDLDGGLWRCKPDLCCHLRKVLPLERALVGFDAWITGRKRYHQNERSALKRIDHDGRRIKINPLADWTRERVNAEYAKRGLPNHPLLSHGYSSVGCAPCTKPVKEGGPIRAGRWSGSAKTECGIHDNARTWVDPQGRA